MTLSVTQGQCSTCKHVAYCSLLGDSKRPAGICERFEEFYSATSGTFGWMAGGSGIRTDSDCTADWKVKSESVPPHIYKGLCSDCENNRKCIFPKTEAGKWHCEEYR